MCIRDRLKALLSRVGLTRLLKKMYISSFLGSTQMHVPVNPICPKVDGSASLAVGVLSGLSVSGPSNPSFLRDLSLFVPVKVLTVAGDII